MRVNGNRGSAQSKGFRDSEEGEQPPGEGDVSSPSEWLHRTFLEKAQSPPAAHPREEGSMGVTADSDS